MTFVEVDYESLTDHLFVTRSVEQAAFLLCSRSLTAYETRLLVRKVLPVTPEEVICASETQMEIAPQSFMRAMKQADALGLSFVFVHSHPDGAIRHSPQDDETERSLFRTAYIRVGTKGAVHGSLVLSSRHRPQGRVWHPDASTSPMHVIRVIGNQFSFYRTTQETNTNTRVFDRQIRAFGSEIQVVLGCLHVGVVGNGGTGSAVAEQLIRLGIGKLSVYDSQALEPSNVTRVYGSGAGDVGRPKVEIVRDHATCIGLNAEVVPFPADITQRLIAESLRDCDIIFGCTDDEWGRSILCRIATDYCIPVFDMGVKIDSHEGRIASVEGRVTTLAPGTACLLCRGRITADGVRADVIQKHDSAQAEELRRQQYAPELHENAPAVIPFTTGIASTAIREFLHRLTGFMGSERVSSEVIEFFDQCRTRTNQVLPKPDCLCCNPSGWACGDQSPFLGMLWQE
jgi:molybdopterin/thiamine biosynthesis adenylyltransferase/proteasome lid subunit RPN8/RPN11